MRTGKVIGQLIAEKTTGYKPTSDHFSFEFYPTHAITWFDDKTALMHYIKSLYPDHVLVTGSEDKYFETWDLVQLEVGQ